MQWDALIDSLNRGRVRRVGVLRDREPVSYAEAIEAWTGDEGFRSFFIGTLLDAPYNAYFWETPPITQQIATRPFEFVLVESPALADLIADPRPFAQHFDAVGAEVDVAAFRNLGGDAFLVAPTPRAPFEAYPHVAAFSRKAPLAQQHAFWRAVGTTMAEQLSDRPLWLSTSGLGVAWLHARLDTWPKYYTFDAYRQPP